MNYDNVHCTILYVLCCTVPELEQLHGVVSHPADVYQVPVQGRHARLLPRLEAGRVGGPLQV